MADDAIRKGEPVVLCRGPHRSHRRRKSGSAKAPDRDADDVGEALVLPEHVEPHWDRRGTASHAPLSAAAEGPALAFAATICPRGKKACAPNSEPRSALAARQWHDETMLAHRSCECAIVRRCRRPRARRVLSCGQLATDWSHKRGASCRQSSPSFLHRGSTGRLARRSKLRVGPTIAVGAVTLALCVSISPLCRLAARRHPQPHRLRGHGGGPGGGDPLGIGIVLLIHHDKPIVIIPPWPQATERRAEAPEQLSTGAP